nr:hypothetical protein [Seleniivibrio woodruffii]
MTKDRRENARNEHSLKATEFIKNALKEEDSILKSHLTDNQAEILGLIILGHSDIKSSKGNLKTIDMINDNNIYQGLYSLEPVRVKLLSAILRIADELDITRDRIGTKRPTGSYDINTESERHFRKLKLIKTLNLNNSCTKIVAHISDDIISDNKENDFELLFEIKTKINNEITSLNEKVFDNTPDFDWRLNSFDYDQNSKFYGEFEEYCKVVSQSALETPVAIQKKPIKVLNSDIEKIITDFVMRNGLFRSGHYKVNQTDFKVRDWIDTHKILLDREMLKSITDAFLYHLMQQEYKYNKILLVGIDFAGMIICSSLSQHTGLPFTYNISKKLLEHHDTEEQSLNYSQIDGVIIVTDVVMHFETIHETIETLKNISNEIEIYHIYTIFDRGTYAQNTQYRSEYINITSSLNNKFDAVVCSKDRNKCQIYMKYDDKIYDNIPI